MAFTDRIYCREEVCNFVIPGDVVVNFVVELVQ